MTSLCKLWQWTKPFTRASIQLAGQFGTTTGRQHGQQQNICWSFSATPWSATAGKKLLCSTSALSARLTQLPFGSNTRSVWSAVGNWRTNQTTAHHRTSAIWHWCVMALLSAKARMSGQVAWCCGKKISPRLNKAKDLYALAHWNFTVAKPELQSANSIPFWYAGNSIAILPRKERHGK